MAADLVTPEAINFMAREGRGLICLSLTEERVAAARAADDDAPTTGPAATRPSRSASTRGTGPPPASRRASGPTPSASPSRATPAPTTSSRPGTSSRCAPGAAACWCARARPRARSIWRASPGREPAGVICEIMRDDGEMARMPDLEAFAAQARPAHHQDRRPHRVPARRRRCWCARSPSRGSARGSAGSRASSALCRLHAPTSRTPSTSRSCWARSGPTSRCWCACRRPACCATCSASAALRTITRPRCRCGSSRRRARGSCSTSFPRGRASLERELGVKAPRRRAVGPAAARLRPGGAGAGAPRRCGTIRLLTNHPRRIVGLGGLRARGRRVRAHSAAGRVVALRDASGGKVPA